VVKLTLIRAANVDAFAAGTASLVIVVGAVVVVVDLISLFASGRAVGRLEASLSCTLSQALF